MSVLSVGYVFVIAGVFVIVGIVTQFFGLIAPYVNSNFSYLLLAPYFLIPGGALMIILGWYEKRKPTGSMWGMKHDANGRLHWCAVDDMDLSIGLGPDNKFGLSYRSPRQSNIDS